VLILGTLPGQASLREHQYYAHPHNQFWRIMGEFFGASRDLPYRDRLRCLKANRVALWDVVASAHRPGSLDGNIRGETVVLSDLAPFLKSHRRIALICFNGGTAAQLYRRLVLPGLPERAKAIRRETLPSTSPAHAAMSLAEKMKRWSVILEILRRDERKAAVAAAL
jgi:hypoxanthine-DNA glycosylase